MCVACILMLRLHNNFLSLKIDIVLLIASTLVSYFLSGRTLAPIEEMVHRQQSFAADASHELRTPLTNIALEIEAHKRTTHSTQEEQMAVLTSIQAEVDRMKGIVEGLLRFVRAEQVDPQPRIKTDLSHVLQSCLDLSRQQFLLKNISFTEQLEKDVIGTLAVDLFRQLIHILLDNAAKYTPVGGVVLVSLSQRNREIIVQVENSGPGIAEEDLSHIFERFYRGERQKEQAGTGLGLAIAHELTAQLNGRLRVQLHPNRTVFALILQIGS
jgi:signal transduction histidine kinase